MLLSDVNYYLENISGSSTCFLWSSAFQKELQDSGSFSAFSLVPALRLADPSQCLALCH